MNIYVGNLSPGILEWKLRREFGKYGKVGKISMNLNASEKNKHAFCFVEMPFDDQANRAISKMNGEIMGGMAITVRESGLSF